MSKLYYCIFKLKKGIFKKSHKGNVHIFVSPAPNSQVFVYVLLGYAEAVSEWVVSLQWKHNIKLMDYVISALKENYGDDFEVVEELESTVKGHSTLEFEVSPKDKGKYIKGPIQFELLTQYSDKNTLIYSIDGDFNLEKVKLKDNEINMADKSISAKLRAILKRLVG